MKKASTRAEGVQVFGRMQPDRAAYAGRMIDLAESNPKDPAARDALIWAFNFLSVNGEGKRFRVKTFRAIDLLVEHHADDPDVARLGLRMDNLACRLHDEFLEGVYANAQGREAKGLARLSLARYLEHKANFAAYAEDQGPGVDALPTL